MNRSNAGTQKEENPSPRVQITYDIDLGDSIEQREVPFVVGILADLSGHPESPPPRLRDRKFIEVYADNFGAVLASIAPRVSFAVPARVLQEKTDENVQLKVDLRFRSMQDFDPASIAEQIPPLAQLLAVRRSLDNLRSAVHANDRLDQAMREILLSRTSEQWQPPADKIERMIQGGLFGVLEEEKAAARESLKIFFDSSSPPPSCQDTEAILTAQISAMDDLLSAQLNEILHHPEFQRLEASWRGLEYLVTQTRTSLTLRLRLLNLSKKEVLKDLQRAVEFDQSVLFKKISEEEYGTLGGSPFSALICDYELGRSADDVYMLAGLSQIAASAAAPVIAATNPQLFNFDDFTQLSMPRDLSKIFDNDAYRAWKLFRESHDSRFAGLVLPRTLMRKPYGRQGVAVEAFSFEEDIDGAEHEKFLWGTAVWAFAVRLTDAFDKFGWCAAISGMEHGGLVRDLPTHKFISDDGDPVEQCPTEIAISDRRRRELEDLGFIPLCHEKGTNRAVFFSAQSCQKPRFYLTDAETRAARARAALENTLAAARFSHYIRCMMRDKIGTFPSPESAARYLNSWIQDYVCLDESATPLTKAKFPLREAHIEVFERPGRIGSYSAKVFLKPHFQLSDLAATLRFEMELQATRG